MRLITAPLFALCVVTAFIIQWLVFIPSYKFQTEKYYDLTGSITYLAVITIAVAVNFYQGTVDTRSLILAALMAIWALRLGTFLFNRIRQDGSDSRFDEIKPHGPRFFTAWTLQGLWVSLTAGAGLAAIASVAKVDWGWVGFVGLAVWIFGFAFEVIADYQKRQHRKNFTDKNAFIQSGLWAWSRHPNYFGEIFLWVGIALIALPALSGWQYATLISPVFVYLLLTRVSGIPMLEAKADKKWGDRTDYQTYKATTPALFPRKPTSR